MSYNGSNQFVHYWEGRVMNSLSLSLSESHVFRKWSKVAVRIILMLVMIPALHVEAVAEDQGPPVNPFCAWPPPYPDPNCTDPLFYGYSKEFYVPVSAMPPCSVKVKVFGSKRCDDFELGDLWWMDDFSPPGCMTREQLFQSYSYGNLIDAIQREFYKLLAIESETEDPPKQIPRCPNVRTYRSGVASPCRKAMVYWTYSKNFVSVSSDPGYVGIEYDPTKPWSWYEAQKPLGATNVQVVMEICKEAGCCMRLVNVCKGEAGEVIVLAGEFISDPISCWTYPIDPNCNVIWCNQWW